MNIGNSLDSEVYRSLVEEFSKGDNAGVDSDVDAEFGSYGVEVV